MAAVDTELASEAAYTFANVEKAGNNSRSCVEAHIGNEAS
jgi:hypothetical protein